MLIYRHAITYIYIGTRHALTKLVDGFKTMAIISMTFEEITRSITPEMEARAREAAQREPDLTDPDAPEGTDEAWDKAYRPGRPFIGNFKEEYKEMLGHFASIEECPDKRVAFLDELCRYEIKMSKIKSSPQTHPHR